ncbi:dihydrofolate reductase [Candidatus Saccharibacteria bacterium]|nr:dihydrofolate reductase [Candidatus Saccharibacteria bacterium]
MIRFIAAIDEKQGMADNHGIPWQGKVPSDLKDFRQETEGGTILMGYGTYVGFKEPLPRRRNLVALTKDEPLRPGFEPIRDARDFLQKTSEDVWVIGGPSLFAETIDLADELHLTHLSGDFHCTKFLPEYKDKFELIEKSAPITENGITYYFARYRKK